MRLSRDSSSDSNNSSRKSARSSAGSRSSSSRSSASSSSSSRSGSAASSGSGRRSSACSVKSNSSDGKGKRKLKASERKVSSKLETVSKLSEDSDSEDESKKDKQANNAKQSVFDVDASTENKVMTGKKTSVIVNDRQLVDEFDDGLDEDLLGDDDDKSKMSNMTEREREEELFKRAEKREELRKRREISKKLLQKQELKGQKVESPLGSEEGEIISSPDSKVRKKGYEVKHAKKFSALSALKAKRDEKEKKDLQKKEKEDKEASKRKKATGKDSSSSSDIEKFARGDGQKKKKMKASEIYSSSSDSDQGKRKKSSSSSSSGSKSSSSGESDTERINTHKSKKVVKKALIIETLGDLERIRLSRHKLDKFVHLPIFKTTVIGCFVKISIGQNVGRGVPVYRVAEVVDVCETAKVYNVGSSRTNIGLRLKHGKESKVFRAQFVSNQPFTDGEFSKWKTACGTEYIELPSMRHVEEKVKAIRKALTYRFSNADVEKIISSKKKFQKNPKNYAVYKAKLMKDKLQYAGDGNTEEVEKLDIQLAELEERAEELDKLRTGSLANISFINNRNRKGNVERAERGITEDIERQKREGKVDDPFTRRKTRPILSMPKNKANMEDSEIKIELEESKTFVKNIDTGKYCQEKENKVQNFQQTKGAVLGNGDNMYNAHDFDIDITIEGGQGSAMTGMSVNPVEGSGGGGSKRNSIKIDEWKRMRGML